MNRAQIFIFIIIGVYLSLNTAYAVDKTAVADTQSSIQDFTAFYQLTNDKVDSLMNLMSILATIFGIIIAIVLAFFTIKQINVDKEINTYKEDIKKQKELTVKEVLSFKEELAQDAKWAENKKAEIQKVLDVQSPDKKDLEKLKKQFEELQEEVASRRGYISGRSSDLFALSSMASTGSIAGAYLGSHVLATCKKCGNNYFPKNNPKVSPYEGTVFFNSYNETSECPTCGNIN